MLPRRARTTVATDVRCDNEVCRHSSVLDMLEISCLSGLTEEPSQEQNPLAIGWEFFPSVSVRFLCPFGSLDLLIGVALQKNLGEFSLTRGELLPLLQGLFLDLDLHKQK